MSHNLMQQDRFISLRKPAWHGLGLVTDQNLSALDAFREIGEVVIRTEPVITTPGGLQTGHKAIISEVVDKATGQRLIQVVSVVGQDYREITHADFCGAWDSAVGQSVETLGILGRGETLFITTKLPTFAVKGDETENYFLAYSPLTGKEAVTGRITPVRVVCQNTLVLSGSQCSATYRATHSSDMARHIEKFLREIWGQLTAKTEAVKDALEILASYRPTEAETRTVLTTVYPEQVKPDVSPYSEDGLKKLAAWEAERNRMEGHRTEVRGLYQGAGVGMDSAACAGTAYGLYNAVVEYEDFGKKHRRAASVVFGAGATRKQIAHAQLLELAAKG